MANLLIRHEGMVFGPYAPAEVQAFVDDGELAADDAAWTEGLVDWEPLNRVLPRLDAEAANEAAPVFTDLALRDDTPPAVKGFCWGAFCMTPIWSIGNRVWPGLLSLLPGLGILVTFWLGFRGRQLAWAKGGWQSVDHFNRVQRRWSIIGAIVMAALIAAAIPLVMLAQQKLAERGGAAPAERAPAPRAGEQGGEPAPRAQAPRGQAPARQPEAEPDAPQARQQPPAADEPAPQPAQGGAGGRPVARDQLEAGIRGAAPADVEAAFGPPNYKETRQGILVYAYLDLTMNPATGATDKATLMLFVNGRLHSVHYKETAE